MLSRNTAERCEVDGDVGEEMSVRKRNMEERVQTLTRELTALKAQPEGEHQRLSDVRLVLVGGEQADRNRAGNIILQDDVFTESLYKEFKSQPKLTECVRHQRSVTGRTVSVVTCPDWSTTPPSQKTRDVLLQAVTLCSPGPHAVLVVVDISSSFCEADRRSVEEHMELLGSGVWNNALVLFLWGYWLGERRVEEYIQAEGEPLRRILEKCSYRYQVLHGLNGGISEITQLMKKTEDMVTRNRGHFKIEKSSWLTGLVRVFRGLNTRGVEQLEGQTTASLPEHQSVPNTESDDQTECYTLSHNPRGTCLIINNEIFTKMANRPGTLKDEEELEKLFSRMGFKVEIRTNQTANDIRRVLKELGGRDFTKADALVVCVLSHGDVGCVFGSDGKDVSLREVMEPFWSRNAPTLAGKPKLFFIQACQGRGYQRGVMPPSPTSSEVQEDKAQSQVQEDGGWISRPEVVPDDADFLISTSTVEECKAFRDTRKGSIYIQALCQQLDRAAKRGGEDLHSVLTDVNRVISRGQYKNYKQMPEYRSRLTQKLVLKFVETTST